MLPWRALQSHATVAMVHSRAKTPEPGAVSEHALVGSPNSSLHSGARGFSVLPFVQPLQGEESAGEERIGVRVIGEPRGLGV